MKQVGACRAATLLRSPLPVPYAEKQQPTQTSLSSNNPPHPSPSPPPPRAHLLADNDRQLLHDGGLVGRDAGLALVNQVDEGVVTGTGLGQGVGAVNL